MTISPTDPAPLAHTQTAELDALDRCACGGHLGPMPAPAPGRYLAIEREGRRRLMELSRPVTHIGRGFAATLQLEDAGVSRRHAIVVQRRGRVFVLDDRSANGTFVNGRRVTEAELSDGDVLAIGRTVLVFVEIPERRIALTDMREPAPRVGQVA